MRYLVSILVAFLFTSTPAFAQFPVDYIKSFESNININQNGSVDITELIQYSTQLDKHGIYRYIPEKYSDQNLTLTRRISNITITDQSGDLIPYTQSRENSNLVLKIGDPDSTFTGDKTYQLSYSIEDALTQQPDWAELYWDITGEGWQIPIQTTIATITSPHASITESLCFSGAFGSNTGNCRFISDRGTTIRLEYLEPIDYGDNLTVALKLDLNGSLNLPTAFQRLQKRILENLDLGFMLLPSVFAIWYWYLKGRDHVFLSDNIFDLSPNKPTKLRSAFASRRIPMVYQPIHQLTPGEAGAILDEKVDNQDIIAEIIDLARKKYLAITASEKKVLFITRTDYTLTKLKPASDNLPKHQHYLYQHLFSTGDTVKLTDLKGTFYRHFEHTKSLINESLTSKALYTKNPGTSRAMAFILFAVVTAASFFLVSKYQPFNTGFHVIFTVVQIPLLIFLAYNAVQKSALGNNYYLQARGLKHTIKVGGWRQKINERNLFIEEVFPFAVAFGVVNQLSKDMEALNLKAPDYLHSSTGAYAASSFNSANFMSGFATAAASTLAYNPSSSSSGGSGFSGGSSGGGGGGGGGGSW